MKLTLKECERRMNNNGGYLDLRGTNITTLPDNLTVGGGLYLEGTNITTGKNVKRLKNGDYIPKRYLYADGILTHIKTRKTIQGYVFYQGKIKNRNVIYDGKNYAHCSTFREGVADLLFKSAADRGADQYKGLSLDTEMSLDELKTMYRIITGAGRQGTENFVASLGDAVKEKYTIAEVIELTKGQYGAERFMEFFN